MRREHIVTAIAAATLMLGGDVARSWSAEHPAEHPAGAGKPTVSLEDVAQHVESYVKQDSKDSAFKIHDQRAGKELSLRLDRVHRDRLSQVGPDMFFVCADFKSADGKLYDVDLFVQGTRKDNLRVLADKTSVHKEDGKERYSWALNNKTGSWEQKPVGAAGR